MWKASDLKPGLKITAPNQGTNISPHTVEIEVHWVTDEDVHYRRGWYPRIYQTPISRFLEIVNAKGP